MNIAAFYDPPSGIFILGGLPLPLHNPADPADHLQPDQPPPRTRNIATTTITPRALARHTSLLASEPEIAGRLERWVSSAGSGSGSASAAGSAAGSDNDNDNDNDDGGVVWWYTRAEISYPDPPPEPGIGVGGATGGDIFIDVSSRIRTTKPVVTLPGGALRRVSPRGVLLPRDVRRGEVAKPRERQWGGEGSSPTMQTPPPGTSRASGGMTLHLPIFVAGEAAAEPTSANASSQGKRPPRAHPPLTQTEIKRLLVAIAAPGGYALDTVRVAFTRDPIKMEVRRFIALPVQVEVEVEVEVQIPPGSGGDGGGSGGRRGGHRDKEKVSVGMGCTPDGDNIRGNMVATAPAGILVPAHTSLRFVLARAVDVAAGVAPAHPPGESKILERSRGAGAPGTWWWTGSEGGIWNCPWDGGDGYGGNEYGRGGQQVAGQRWWSSEAQRTPVTLVEWEGWEWERARVGCGGCVAASRGEIRESGVGCEPHDGQFGVWDVVWRRAFGGLGGGGVEGVVLGLDRGGESGGEDAEGGDAGDSDEGSPGARRMGKGEGKAAGVCPGDGDARRPWIVGEVSVSIC